jgi:hypothetical protein
MVQVIDALKGDLDAVVVGATEAADLRQPVGYARDGAGEIERCLGSHLALDGQVGSFASIDSTSLLDISDSQWEVWFDIAPRRWDGGTIGETYFGRWADDTSQRSWRIHVGGGGGGGSLFHEWSSTGANSANVAAAPQLFSLTNDRIRMKFRIMFDVSTINLTDNRVFRRYADTDPWFNMQKHFQTGGVPLFNGTADFRIGDHGPGPVANPMLGQFFSLRIWDGWRERGGVEIVNIDFTKLTPGVTSFEEDAQGLTVNLNGGTEIKAIGSQFGDFRYRLRNVGSHHPIVLKTDANIELLRGRLNVAKSLSRGVAESSGVSRIDPEWDSDLRVPILKSQSAEEYNTALRNATGSAGLMQLESQIFSEAYFDELRLLVLERVIPIRERTIRI